MATTSSSYTKLTPTCASFNAMLRHFGVVTVMNAVVYDIPAEYDFSAKKVDEIYTDITEDESQFTSLCSLKTLKIANVAESGPTKTITGGQYNNPLIKFGKTATLSIQDALGNAEAVEALCGGVVEHFHTKPADLTTSESGDTDVLHVTSNFSGPKLILGDSYFIDEATGTQVPVKIIFYQFLPDSLFNLTQDASGDATVFDMNGSLLVTTIKVGTDSSASGDTTAGVFYSVLSGKGVVGATAEA
jgi:hypothetical protein